MAIFDTFVGQDANKSEGSDFLVVNNNDPLNFTFDGGSETFLGDDPNTAFDESLDDTVSYTDYDGYTYVANFTINYEGAFNWSNGNGGGFDPVESSEAFIIEITNVISTSNPDGGVDEIGETWTIITDDTPPPGGTFGNGNHRAGPLGDNVICFVRGTKITTPYGDVLVENIAIGDRVETADSGTQIVRWIGSKVLKPNRTTTPVRIAKGALGENTPNQELLVSPAHRMLISGWRAEVLFGGTEYLVAAKDLVNKKTITFARELKEVEYFHILFDKHEIVNSNGALSESFHPNVDALNTLEEDALAELIALFPELGTESGYGNLDVVRPSLTPSEATLLA